MNNKPEIDSCKDIAADLREDARQIRRAREIATRIEPQPTLRGRFLDEIFEAYADRIEAAISRERLLSKPPENDNSAPVVSTGDNKPGNAVAMREALLMAIALLEACDWPDDAPMRAIAEEMDKIKKAALAPPRNCDLYSGDRKMLYTAWWIWTGSPSGQNPDGTVKLTFAEWLLAIVQTMGVAKW